MNNCPYCSCTTPKNLIEKVSNKNFHFCYCENCGLASPPKLSLEEAIEIWNRIRFKKDK